MVTLHVFANAEDMALDPSNIVIASKDMSIGVLEGGMTSGKPSVSMAFELPDGKTVFAETSLALFLTTARAFAAKYGWPEDWDAKRGMNNVYGTDGKTSR